MDHSDIKVVWDEYDIGYATVHVPLFGQDIMFEFIPSHSPSVITPRMWLAAEQVLALPRGDIEKVAALLWEEAHFSFTVADYGVEALAGESHLEAHLRDFGLSGPSDALAKATVRAVQINHKNDACEGVYALIQISAATDNYISVIVKDGEIVDYDDDGCWVAGFDANPRAAHDARAKVMSGG